MRSGLVSREFLSWESVRCDEHSGGSCEGMEKDEK